MHTLQLILKIFLIKETYVGVTGSSLGLEAQRISWCVQPGVRGQATPQGTNLAKGVQQ